MKDLARDAISGLPEYIPGKQVEEVVKQFSLKEVIKLASNENPLGTSPLAVESIKDNARFSYIYPDQRHTILKEALSAKLNISKDNLIIGNGSDEIMLLIAQVFLSAGDEVILSRNTFSMYEFVTKIMDGTPVFVELKNYTYDLDAISSVVTDRTKAIFLCNPNNPTGTIFSKKQFDLFISKIPDNVIVVLDEAYGDYSESQEFADGIEHVKSGKNLIVLKTFSKIYGLAALRIGYGIASPKIIDYLHMAKMPFNVNRIGQLAALAALGDEKFFKDSIENNKHGKEYLYAELKKMGLKFLETQANFIYIEFNENSDRIFVDLMKEGVIIRPLKSFGLPNSIRATIGAMPQNKKFIASLKKVLAE
ncbi:MAG: histidinol-phosphate transaminase [Candidatus Margulisiibacteriota bacterium]